MPEQQDIGMPRFPGFEIIETMPRGGMSTVYKARQISLDRIVALKALPPMLAVESADLNQFLSEARITANLKHPNIVQVYDFGHTDEGVYYFVMEFISGYSVGDWIRRKHCLSEQNSLLIAGSVAEALNYAWKSAGVVHCDIKPDNIIIDGDGTIKVADLGLAKSVRSVVNGAKTLTGMVFGTPNYISPEQSRGDVDLDCRTDIYSLGTTLYHAMTGKMPFEGAPAVTAMDLQITDYLPDAQDLNHHISTESSMLIEIMLAKDRNRRQADWEAVLVDINRVLQHKMPQEELPLAGASTMSRSAHRGARPRVKASMTLAMPVLAGEPAPDTVAFQQMQRRFLQRQQRRKGSNLEWWFAAVIAIAVLILGIMIARGVMRKKPPDMVDQRAANMAQPAPAPAANATPAPAEVAAAREKNAREMFEFAKKWAQDNPAQLSAALDKYRQVAQDTRGTKYAFLAQEEIDKTKEALTSAMRAVMSALENQAAPLLAGNEFAKAVELYEQYQGNLAEETKPRRTVAARELRERDREFQEQQRKLAEEADRQWRELLDRVGDSLAGNDVPGARELVKQAAEIPLLDSRKTELAALADVLAEAARLDQRIIDAYKALKGQDITVTLTSGAEKMTIRDVKDDTVQAEQTVIVGAGHISRSKTFRCADLAPAEKHLRLSSDGKPGMELMQGLLSVRERDWAAAESWFAKATPLLSAALVANVRQKQSRQGEEQARRELLALLKTAQIEMPREGAGLNEYLAALAKKRFTAQETEKLAKAVERYRAAYGQTQVAGEFEPVLQTLSQPPQPVAPERAPTHQPLPHPKLQAAPDGAAPRALAQADDIRKQLLDRNRDVGYREIEMTADGEGRVTRLAFFSGALKDIRPLTGLSELRCLEIKNYPPLADLSPLRGLRLETVHLHCPQLKDITPLAGMPLAGVSLVDAKVTDFSALKGMHLTSLNLSGAKIRDIGVLRNMPLQHLNLNRTEVVDLSPLTGNASLRELFLSQTAVRDLAPLKGARLEALDLSETPLMDFTPLADMPLTKLSMARCKGRNFSFLAGMSLFHLNVAQTEFQDLGVLKGMPLKHLDLSGTSIREQDLALLQTLPLELLNLQNTCLRDLEVLQPIATLRELNIKQTQVRQLDPLFAMPGITTLWMDEPDNEQARMRQRGMLLRMVNLQRLNGQPVYVGGWRPGGWRQRRE